MCQILEIRYATFYVNMQQQAMLMGFAFPADEYGGNGNEVGNFRSTSCLEGDLHTSDTLPIHQSIRL
jgi:hypothetical protein